MEWLLILLAVLVAAGAMLGSPDAAVHRDAMDSDPDPGRESEEDYLARERAFNFSQDDHHATDWRRDDDD